MPAEKRIKMVGCHLTQPEKQFLRAQAARNDMTISDFIRKTLTDVLSKVKENDNPFTTIKNN